jgi:UDP-N-acetylglucosamine transferase subunit ALG13
VHALGEHVDDHQVELVRALEARGEVIGVWDVAALAEAVRSVPPRRSRRAASREKIQESVREALDGMPPNRRTSR